MSEYKYEMNDIMTFQMENNIGMNAINVTKDVNSLIFTIQIMYD